MVGEPFLCSRLVVTPTRHRPRSRLDLYPGEILAVIGDNGAGKSSIKAISGAITVDEGGSR